jgi:Glycosyl transferase family 2
MKIVMILVVRDEEDIVDEQLRFHLEQGVDFVIATDHRSVDGTTDILRSYEREGHLHLIREEREDHLHAEFSTTTARLAATDFGADWVIHADADEFWWPREGSFADIFRELPSRFGVVHGFWRHFVLRPDGAEPFFERMLWRRRPSPDADSPYHPSVKVAHRAHPDVELMHGNHKILGRSLETLPDWLPIEVLHFPIRSVEQLRRKFARARGTVSPARYRTRIESQLEEDGMERLVAELVVDDDALSEGRASGALTHDTRVRDALRSSAHAPPRPTVTDDVALASEYVDLHFFLRSMRVEHRLDGIRQRVEGIGG